LEFTERKGGGKKGPRAQPAIFVPTAGEERITPSDEKGRKRKRALRGLHIIKKEKGHTSSIYSRGEGNLTKISAH